MKELLEVLNALIEKYNIEEADVAMLQDVLSKIEGNDSEEFDYKEEE